MVLVFTQFMVVANLLGRIAYLEKKKFLYYTGDMSANARKLALAKFRTDNSVKILVRLFPSLHALLPLKGPAN